jgi:hypothetical protein
LRTVVSRPRLRRRVILVAATALAGSLASIPRASAEGLFDFFFGGAQKQQQQQNQAPPQASFFADPFGLNQPPGPPPRPAMASVSGPAFCVRSCDGRYFPLMRSNASPVAICQAFCPASATKVFFGSSIDGATSANGERYADSENAFAYRKALRADCTCNGRGPAGLAAVDLTLDTSLHPGDVIATANGLVAYSGAKVGTGQTAEFTPVAAYPGLTTEVRARLGEMKVAPVTAEMMAGDTPAAEAKIDATPLAAPAPKTAARPRDKRAEAN